MKMKCKTRNLFKCCHVTNYKPNYRGGEKVKYFSGHFLSEIFFRTVCLKYFSVATRVKYFRRRGGRCGQFRDVNMGTNRDMRWQSEGTEGALPSKQRHLKAYWWGRNPVVEIFPNLKTRIKAVSWDKALLFGWGCSFPPNIDQSWQATIIRQRMDVSSLTLNLSTQELEQNTPWLSYLDWKYLNISLDTVKADSLDPRQMDTKQPLLVTKDH